MSEYKELLKEPALRREYERESLYEDALSDIEGLLHSRGLTQAELARRLGVSPGRVSQLLSGRRNLTLKTLADAAWALGMRAKLAFEPIEDLSSTPAEDDEPIVPRWLSRRVRNVDWEIQVNWLPVGTPICEYTTKPAARFERFHIDTGESLVG